MVFRPGSGVTATDESRWTLVDVVVDPLAGRISHIVIAPGGSLELARLVPMRLVTDSSGSLRVRLDGPHLGQLQRVLESDYLRLDSSETIVDTEVRFPTVLVWPHFDDPSQPDATGHGVAPTSSVEIRRGSSVTSCNGYSLGTVEALMVRRELVYAVVVRTTLLGLSRDLVVPLSSVGEVNADGIILDLDRHEFRRLPRTGVVPVQGRERSQPPGHVRAAKRAIFATRDAGARLTAGMSRELRNRQTRLDGRNRSIGR